MKKTIACPEPNCEADFEISHQMDDIMYQVSFCPFCGTELEQDLIIDDEDWDE